MYYYEYYQGNNSPASRLRLIGDKQEFEREKKRRQARGQEFFEIETVDEDLGEVVQKRELDGHRIDDNQALIPRRGRL